MPVSPREINSALRRSVWPFLADCGFNHRTERAAWRFWDEGVDVAEISLVGAHADSIGCSPVSFSAHVGSLLEWLPHTTVLPAKGGQARPHYWHCGPVARHLTKTLAQPWFSPFMREVAQRTRPMQI